jgi:hypothetical protein
MPQQVVWTGDDERGYLGRGDGELYTIMKNPYSGTYETRQAEGPAKDLEGLSARRLCNLYGYRIVAGVKGNCCIYTRPTSSVDEAKIIAQADYEKRLRYRSRT